MGTLWSTVWSSQNTQQPVLHAHHLQQEQPALNLNTTWNCSRPWPHKLEIMLPIVLTDDKVSHRNREWVDVFLRGLLLFWPAVQLSKMTINLVIDEEIRRETPHLIQRYVHDYVQAGMQQLPHAFPPIRIQYNKYLPRLYQTGHDRQQYLMFWADQYTSSHTDYVAFFDTDVLVHSYVDREDLFEQNKAVVHGRISRWKSSGIDKHKRWWTEASYKAIGQLQPFTCMSYFPILIQRNHFSAMRQHIMRHLNVQSFQEAYKIIAHDTAPYRSGFGTYSQFNIFCTYLWWYQRDHYTWYVHDTDPHWNGLNDSSYRPTRGELLNKSVFSYTMKHTPKPFLAAHLGGRHKKDAIMYSHTIADLLGSALCYRLRNSSVQYVPLIVGSVKPSSQISPRSVNLPSQIPSLVNQTHTNHHHHQHHDHHHNGTHKHHHNHTDNHILDSFLLSSQLIWRRVHATKCNPLSPSNTHLPQSNTHPSPIDSTHPSLTPSPLHTHPPSIHYNPEMHRFEEMDFNRPGIVDPLALVLVQEEREKRLQHCSHTYLFI